MSEQLTKAEIEERLRQWAARLDYEDFQLDNGIECARQAQQDAAFICIALRELLVARARIAELEAENAQQKETLRLIGQAFKQHGIIGLAVWEMA